MTHKHDKKSDKYNDNLFREMAYELAGDIGAVDNEDMKINQKLMNGRKPNSKTK